MAMAVNFENIKFSQNIDMHAIDTVNNAVTGTNGVVSVKTPDTDFNGIPPEKIRASNGITFDIYEDGELKFFFDTTDDNRDPMDRIFVNGKKMSDEIHERIRAGIEQNNRDLDLLSPPGVSNIVSGITYNPLLGKKLAVIGDSLTVSPSKELSYGAFIAKRNNMVLVNKGRGGEKLCNDRTNALGQATNISTIKSYTNDIPVDADFILVQIGTNDAGDWWTRDKSLSIPDTDMTTNTFKGCFNNLLIGLKTYYPNAKIGIILPHCWGNNVGTNSEDVISSGATREVADWEKKQCHRLSIPVFDPVVDSRMVLWNAKTVYTNGTNVTSTEIQDSAIDWFEQTKRRIGTSQNKYTENKGYWQFQSPYFLDGIHMSEKGSLLMSFYYENWMKTVLMAN